MIKSNAERNKGESTSTVASHSVLQSVVQQTDLPFEHVHSRLAANYHYGMPEMA
jgi:hypothetical protein